MPNQTELIATIFQEPTYEVGESFGFRMFDKYAKTYVNTLESVITDPKKLLEKAMEFKSDDIAIKTIIDYLNEEKEGMYINGTWFEYSQIEHIINPK